MLTDDACDEPRHAAYVCYLLESNTGGRPATYVGVTNSMKRRIRQHNGELCGGAKATSRRRPWSYAAFVGPFDSYRCALQFEWAWKHARPRRSHGMLARVKKLRSVLMRERWTKNAPRQADHSPLTVTVLSDSVASMLDDVVLPCHVIVDT